MLGRLWFRLLIGTCLVLAVTLGAVILLVSRALTGSFQDYVEDQQSARVQRAESILSRYYDRRREWTGVESLVQSVADLMGERLVLADAQNRIVADSQNLLVGQVARDGWRGRRVSLRSQEFAVGTLYISPTMVDQPALDPRAQIFLTTFASYLVWALLVGLLAAIILSVGMSRLLASPLEALTRAVRRLERGYAVQRIDTAVGGEVGDLAEAFNSLAASLVRVEELRQNMVSDVAHELRTPLTSIRGYIEAIQDGVVEPNEETLATIHHEMLQITRLVDDLQELSLAEAHQLQLDHEEVDLVELAEWEVRAFQPEAAAQGVELRLAVPTPIPPLFLDAGRIRQVLGNLIRNALAHTPGAGSIVVGVRRQNNEAVLTVMDTGAGIEPSDLEHIFERFYRVDKARARRAGGGTGLGLTIARELVRAHGGTISATSTVGEGTTFRVVLPYVVERSAEPDHEASAQDLPAPVPVLQRLAPVVWRATLVAALVGGFAGTVESLISAAAMRRSQSFMDLFGYAVLIDGAAFAALGGVATLIACLIIRMSGRCINQHRITLSVTSVGLVLVGLLIGTRWNQLFNKDTSFDSPESLYPVALVVLSSAVLALVVAFAVVAIPQRWPRGGHWLRTAPSLLLVMMLTASTVLVGRDQVVHRLADAPPSAAARRVTTPRSPESRPPVPEGVATSATATPGQIAGQTTLRPPNVLLITVSGLRADHLGAYGYEKARTPAIDALARRGIRFDNALTQQPDRNAAHAAILTGTFPGTNGVRHDLVDRVDLETPSLAQTMADHGYRTGAIYSWVSLEPGYSGLDRGFHDYLDLTINRPEYLADNRGQVLSATYERLKAYLALPSAMGDAFSLSGGVDEAIDGRADVTTEAAIAWLEQYQAQPFFLWVHYLDPSPPFTPPHPFDELEDSGCAEACPDGSTRTIREVQDGAQLTAAQINHLVSLYDGEIAFTDQQIGRLIERLDRLGLENNTLIVLTSDHGQSFAEHDSWFAGSTLYNAAVRVPMIVSLPNRLPRQRAVPAPTMSIDLAPTILDTIGADVPEDFEGESLLPLILGNTTGDDRLAFTELSDRSEVAVADRFWKLIWSSREQTAHLFYLGDDPNELHDRAEAEPDTTARLIEVLRQWLWLRPG